jgi:hypothetical protein
MAGLDSTWELDPLLDTFHIDGSRRTATRVVASPARDALTKPACSRRAEAELVRSDTVQSWKLDALGLPELVALAGLVGFGVVLRSSVRGSSGLVCRITRTHRSATETGATTKAR